MQKYLDDRGVDSIILMGMQTEYCIDTTCKVAFEYGYSLLIPQNTTTTYDNNLCSGEILARYYEQRIWNQRFAKVITIDEIMHMISGTFTG